MASSSVFHQPPETPAPLRAISRQAGRTQNDQCGEDPEPAATALATRRAGRAARACLPGRVGERSAERQRDLERRDDDEADGGPDGPVRAGITPATSVLMSVSFVSMGRERASISRTCSGAREKHRADHGSGAIERVRLREGSPLWIGTGQACGTPSRSGPDEVAEGRGDKEFRGARFWVKLARKGKQAEPIAILLLAVVPGRDRSWTSDGALRSKEGEGSIPDDEFRAPTPSNS